MHGLLVLIDDKLLAQSLGHQAAEFWVGSFLSSSPPLQHVSCGKVRLDPAEAVWPGKSMACQHGITDSRRETGYVSFLAESFALR